VIPYLQQCFDVPLIRREIHGTSLHTGLDYHLTNANNKDDRIADGSADTMGSNRYINGSTNIDCNCRRSESHGSNEIATVYDEVEDLFQLLQDVKHMYPDIEGVSCGAIISTYQRLRVENVCSRLNLTCLAYLWQKDRMDLLHEMMTCDHQGTSGRSSSSDGVDSEGGYDVDDHVDNNNNDGDISLIRCPIDAVLIKVAGAGLDPLKHLNRSIASLLPILTKLHYQLGLDVCGEGGEYESLVLDCSAFKKYKLVLEETMVVVDEENSSVGYLKILKCSCQLKDSGRSGSRHGQSVRSHDALLLSDCRKFIEQSREDLIGQKGALISQKCDTIGVKGDLSIRKVSITYTKSIDNIISHHNHTGSLSITPTITINKDGIGQSSFIFSQYPVPTDGVLDNFQRIKLELKEIMTNLLHCLSKYRVILGDIVFVHLYIVR